MNVVKVEGFWELHYEVTELPKPNGVCVVCGDPTYDLQEHGSVCAMYISPYPMAEKLRPRLSKKGLAA